MFIYFGGFKMFTAFCTILLIKFISLEKFMNSEDIPKLYEAYYLFNICSPFIDKPTFTFET